ncbi:MAG: response regulator [Planctomycetota bacterium]|nr:response regulator [Planctomycetota bacterium]
MPEGERTPAGGGRRPLRALALDDDPAVAKLIAEALRASGWTVEAFSDPAMAVRRLAESEFDLVVSDLAMTDVSGMDVLAAAKRESPSVKVILVSGFGTMDLAVEAMKRGASDFVSKPFTISEIREKVAAVCGRSAASEVGGRIGSGSGTGSGIAASPAASRAPGGGPAVRSLREVEKAAILEALDRDGWNIAAAARDLGISRSALYDKMARHGIRPPGRSGRPGSGR